MDQASQESQQGIFCPSCAARIEQPVTPGTPIKCPVCGTEFTPKAGQSVEAAVVESDRPATTPTAKRLSTEEILLERLKNDQPSPRKVSWKTLALVLVLIAGATIGIVLLTSKPDKYAAGSDIDSSQLLQQRMMLQHVVDSVKGEIAKDPNNINLHLSLADALYDVHDWDASIREFEVYLKAKPSDPDARVDYAYAIAQKNDISRAIAEIDTALKYKPDHLNALVNAGILSMQAVGDSNHTEALANSKKYLERAKAVADKTNPQMAIKIDTLIQEIDRTGQRLKMK